MLSYLGRIVTVPLRLEFWNPSICFAALFITPPPILSGRGYCFRSISLFVSLSARLPENGWTDLHEIFREGVE